MKSLRLVLALTLLCLSASVSRAADDGPVDPLSWLAAKIDIPATSTSPGGHSTAWLYEIDDEALYFLTSWPHLSEAWHHKGFAMGGKSLGVSAQTAKLIGTAPGYGISVLSVPRAKLSDTTIAAAKTAIAKAYPLNLPDGEVRVGLYGYSLSPRSREDATHALIAKTALTYQPPQKKFDFFDPFELSKPTRLTHVPSTSATPFVPYCLEVALPHRMTSGAGLAMSPTDTNQAKLFLGGIAMQESGRDTTTIVPIKWALAGAFLARKKATNGYFVDDISGALSWIGPDYIAVKTGPLADKVVRSANLSIGPAFPEYLKALPGPFASADRNWAGFGFYPLAQVAVDDPKGWSQPGSFLVDFSGFRHALPDLAHAARHRAGIRIDGRIYHRLNGHDVVDVAAFCARYLNEPSDRLSTTDDAFRLPAKLKLKAHRMGVRTFADLRRVITRAELVSASVRNDTGFPKDTVATLVRAYGKNREYSDPLKLVDILVAKASQKNFAIIGKATLEREARSTRITTTDTLFGEGKIVLDGSFESDGPRRYRYVGKMELSTASRYWVESEVRFTTKAWGVATIDELSDGRGFQVTVLAAHLTPKEAVGPASLLSTETIGLDLITFRAE